MRKGGRMKAFVLVKVEPGKIREVSEAIAKMRNVKEVYCLTGPDDLIVLMEADDARQVSEVILGDMHGVGGIKGTDTRLVVELQ